jgi:hypothetical protein
MVIGVDDALIAASLASSAAGAIKGVTGGGNANEAANVQNDINFRNYYLQQRLASLQEEMARAGSVNARGDKTEYVPGVGWVTRQSAQTDALIKSSDQEQRLRNTTDASRSRMRRENTFGRQANEGQQADAILGGINTGQQTPADLRAAMIEANVAKAVSGGDDMRKRIGMVSLRSGSGGQQALADISRNNMMDTRSAIADANLNAPDEYNARRSARVNPRLNQYNMLAERATNADDVSFQPTTLEEGLTASARSRANMAPQSIGSAMNVDAPRVGYSESRKPVGLDSLGSFLLGAKTMGNRNKWWDSSGGGAGGAPSAGGGGDGIFTSGYT